MCWNAQEAPEGLSAVLAAIAHVQLELARARGTQRKDRTKGAGSEGGGR